MAVNESIQSVWYSSLVLTSKAEAMKESNPYEGSEHRWRQSVPRLVEGRVCLVSSFSAKIVCAERVPMSQRPRRVSLIWFTCFYAVIGLTIRPNNMLDVVEDGTIGKFWLCSSKSKRRSMAACTSQSFYQRRQVIEGRRHGELDLD